LVIFDLQRMGMVEKAIPFKLGTRYEQAEQAAKLLREVSLKPPPCEPAVGKVTIMWTETRNGLYRLKERRRSAEQKNDPVRRFVRCWPVRAARSPRQCGWFDSA
jgi:hypothetical protein